MTTTPRTPSEALRESPLDHAHLPLTAAGRIDGRSARKVETKRKIILAASELIAEHGYAGASMDDIAEAAQVSKGTIFYNFTNKQELFEQLLRHSVVTVAGRIDEARTGLEGWEALEAATWALMTATLEAPAAAQIVLNEMFRRQASWSDLLLECRTILVGPFVQLLHELALRRERLHGARALGADEASTVAMGLIGAVVIATLDHHAFRSSGDLREVHASLMRSISAVRV